LVLQEALSESLPGMNIVPVERLSYGFHEFPFAGWPRRCSRRCNGQEFGSGREGPTGNRIQVEAVLVPFLQEMSADDGDHRRVVGTQNGRGDEALDS